MICHSLCMIGLPEAGVIASVAVILFGCKAVSQNPILTKKQKIVWMITVVVLNWIGLLWYYYMFYMRNEE